MNYIYIASEYVIKSLGKLGWFSLHGREVIMLILLINQIDQY